jgi:arginine exporter protein ArgO
MHCRDISAILILICTTVLGFVALILGAAYYKECSNDLGVWLAVAGACVMSASLTVCSRIETSPLQSPKYGWFDLLIVLFVFSVNVWGSVLLGGTTVDNCSAKVYQYTSFAVAVLWFVLVCLIAVGAIKFRDVLEKQNANRNEKERQRMMKH